MAGYQKHQQRQAAIQKLGKDLGRRAEFRCEWCEGRGELRPHDLAPREEPSLVTLVLLCSPCRELAEGVKPGNPDHLRHLAGAIWSPYDPVKESVAQLLARLGTPWAREAIEESDLDEERKRELLGD
jgi:hypothetical protein